MKLLRPLLTAAVTAIAMIQPCFAQDGISAPSRDNLIGIWIVTIDGEREARTLTVAHEKPTSEGVTLTAKYGISTLGQSPAVADIQGTSATRQFKLRTQADSIINATENSLGTYSGTFTFKGGAIRKVSIARTAGRQLEFVYLGGPDCPVCKGWEMFDLPKLRSHEVFAKVRYTKISKFIQSEVPSAFWFPNEVKHLSQPIADRLKGAGSPMFAILVDDKVISAWLGVKRSPEEIIRALDNVYSTSMSSKLR